MKKEVWIVEDDHFLRESYKSIISSSDHYRCTKTFRSGEEILKSLQPPLPAIILMDIELPGMNGVECTDKIKSKFPGVLIIMVTVYEDSVQVFNSLRAGASGYIIKNANYTQLLSAIDEIESGGAPISGKIAKLIIDSFHRNPDSPLTKRETQILQMVASGKTFTQISDLLFISRETTKTHVRNIYEKLEVDRRADAIEKAQKSRYI